MSEEQFVMLISAPYSQVVSVFTE